MFGISGEHLLVLGIVLLIFGPRRLPELGNTMGKAIRNFKDALSGVEEAQFRQVQAEEAKKQEALSKLNSAGGVQSVSPLEPVHSVPAAEKVEQPQQPTV